MYSFADLVFNLPLEDSYTYDIRSFSECQVGMRVEAEFNHRILTGIVVAVHNQEPSYKVKPLKRVIDKEPVINQDQFAIANWMKDYYLSTLGECLFKISPAGKRSKEKTILSEMHPESIKSLNSEQNNIFQNIKNDLGNSACHLLYGITGSGKTEIYIHLIHEVIAAGKGAILLVPEITLTVQMISRLKAVFGENLALMHSALKTSERFQSYMDLLHGQKKIAVGTRSAIFAPVQNPGIIIIDEEHDSSYKDHSAPRYHARQIAFFRSSRENSVLVLGSATPSVEVYYQAKTGTIKLNELRKRANDMPLPVVTVHKTYQNEMIGNDLLFQIKKRLDRKEQTILLLNRRGHSPLIYLKDKKSFLECPNCTANLCYHANAPVTCHLCGYKTSFSGIQKKYGDQIELQGKGTQKLEEYLLEKFPTAKIERLDQDSARNREVLTEVIHRLIQGEIDILTGTQMISKGLDAGNVTLVGVVNANIGLGLPDFRAQERVFATLTQVAGRAGRSHRTGEVIIESSDPTHPVIQLAIQQDFLAFFQNEIQHRKDLFYPPFSRIIRIVSRSKLEDSSGLFIQKIKTRLDQNLKGMNLTQTIILGPAPCPFYKIDSNYRNHIIIKTTDMTRMKEILKNTVKEEKADKNVYLEIDIDPVDLL